MIAQPLRPPVPVDAGRGRSAGHADHAGSAAPTGGAPTPLAVQRWRDGRFTAEVDWLADELPVALEYNGVAHAVMMCSPDALDELALGFSVSEGIVAGAHELLDLDVYREDEGLRVAMRITAQRFAALKERRRNLAGRTGCGLCGVDSLAQALRTLPPVAGRARFDPARLSRAMAQLDDAQPLRRLTGAAHAAGWMRADGSLACVREDIGRHNALDKLIGALLGAGTDPASGAALLTSRASVEMVQKAAAAGISALVARSAPTALAVRQARALNVLLVGFARGGSLVVYAQAARLRRGEPS